MFLDGAPGHALPTGARRAHAELYDALLPAFALGAQLPGELLVMVGWLMLRLTGRQVDASKLVAKRE